MIYMVMSYGKACKNWIISAAVLLLAAACAPLSGAPRENGSSGEWDASAPVAENADLFGSGARLLSAAEKKQAMTAEYEALEHKKTDEAAQWGLVTSRAYGAVTPGQPYRVGAQNCRQYSHDWTINGVPYNVRGSACRNDDGSWTPLL